MTDARLTLNLEFIEGEMKRRKIHSVNELAREIGISESMMNKLMRQKRSPGSKAVGLMLSYFNVKFEVIFMEVLTKVHRSA